MTTPRLRFILNSALATSAPGGANAARVQNEVGDLFLWSSNAVGIQITTGTGAVGVGKTAAVGVALDVSGLMHSTSFGGGCISDALTLTSSAVAASATALSNVNITASGALQRTGGVMTGLLTCSNLSVIGTIETINAYVTMSSNVVISNSGTGIGPALTVSQTQAGTQTVAQFSAGATTALFISSTGNVGIGHASAAYALDVVGNTLITGTLQTSSNITVYGTLGIGKPAPVGGFSLDISGSVNISGILQTSSNVAIGKPVSNPNFQLDVSGNVNISGGVTATNIAAVTHTGTNMTLTGTAITSNMTVFGPSTQYGNTGIGKAPVVGGTYALDVSGSVNVSGTITSGGNVGFKTFYATGTLASAVNGGTNFPLPTGVTCSNIIGVTAILNTGSLIINSGSTRDTAYYWDYNIAGNTVYLKLGSSASSITSATVLFVFTTNS